MKDKKILVAGGTGFIGQAIAKYFGKENDIVILGRGVKNHANNRYNSKNIQSCDGYRVKYCCWDGKTKGEWTHELETTDIVINLAGKSVNCRYHRKQKREILESRLNATRIIGEAIASCIHPPKLWINAASATIYRNTYERPNDEFNGIISIMKNENMPWSFVDRIRYYKNRLIRKTVYGKTSLQYQELDLDFSIQVCRQWEETFFAQRTPFTRKIALRTAVTLGEGGVITPYLNLCKFALGGSHGSGLQMYSWVHIEDVCRMVEWLYHNKAAEGIYNCVAPNAVTNKSFMQTLRCITGHKVGLPAPAWLLELGAWLIGTETELMLKSRWVYPKRAMHEGFQFKYPTLREALVEIVSALPRRTYHLF